MAVKYVDLDDIYTVTSDNNNIKADVTIGDGQDGSYAIFLGTDFIISNETAKLGKGKDVRNKKTLVSVVIVDELQETNWTSMTVTITEGTTKKVFGPYRAEAENHLDTIIYTLKISNQ